MIQSKSDVARTLAHAHYQVEPGLVQIVQLLASPEKENDPTEPIKLLEINENTTSDGIRPIFFGPRPAHGISFPSVIVEITPDEFDEVRKNPSLLPNDWSLGEEIPRRAIAAAG